MLQKSRAGKKSGKGKMLQSQYSLTVDKILERNGVIRKKPIPSKNVSL